MMRRLYHCDFCECLLATRKAMREHEARCGGNPATRGCCTCNFALRFPDEGSAKWFRRKFNACEVLGRVLYTQGCEKWEANNGKTKWVGRPGNDFFARKWVAK